MCTHQEGQQGSLTLDYFVVIGNENAKEIAGVHFRWEEEKRKEQTVSGNMEGKQRKLTEESPKEGSQKD